MEQTPDFLKSNDGMIDETTMTTLESLIQAYDEAKELVDITEDELKEYKKRFNAIALDRLPEFLLMHGISKINLKDGREVNIKEDISATVKDDIAFRRWLRDRNEDAIIKVKYVLGNADYDHITALTDYLMEHDFDFEIDESIHSQTKKKYFKELLKEINQDQLPEWVSIYNIRKAVVK